MAHNGAEEGKREFLLSHNEKLNTQTERTYFIQKENEDLIFYLQKIINLLLFY